jgi:molecular chaperone DnaJ
MVLLDSAMAMVMVPVILMIFLVTLSVVVGRRQRTRDIEHNLHISFDGLENGIEFSLTIIRRVLCLECGGNDCVKGTFPTRCPDCDGPGRCVHAVRMGPMVTQQLFRCSTCNGNGESIDSKDRCPKCHAKEIVYEKKTISAYAESGMEDGERLVFQWHADAAAGCHPGHLVVHLSMK